MTEKLKQTIEEEIIKLPKEAQGVISAFDWVKITEEIGKKYSLDEDKLNNFQVETLLVLIGATDPEFYAVNVENHVGTTKEEASKISGEAFEKIFIPVYNKLIENTKNNLKTKNPNWQQNVDFILSGGDYSAFVASTRESSPPLLDKEGNEGRFLKNSPHPNPLLVKERGNTSTPITPPTLADIKSQFKI